MRIVVLVLSGVLVLVLLTLLLITAAAMHGDAGWEQARRSDPIRTGDA